MKSSSCNIIAENAQLYKKNKRTRVVRNNKIIYLCLVHVRRYQRK